SGQLTNATTVTFARSGTSGAVTIKWYVAEFTSGVSVQRGSAVLSTSTTDVTLPTAVDLSKSFPLVSQRTDGVVFSNNDFVKAKLTTTTNLQLAIAGTPGAATVEWQVIEFTGA